MTLVAPDLGLECDVLLEVEGFINKHGEWLIFKEQVFFFGAKNTAGVWVLAGSEVAGLDGAATTAHREDLGERRQEVVLDEGDGDSGSAIERCNVAVVGVWDPTRAGVDADKGSVVRGCTASFNEVVDKVIDGHDDSGVVDFGDRGRAAADMGDLLDELFSGEAEVTVDGFWDQLQVEWRDWQDRGSGVDRVDFVAVAADEGVLFRELLERG
jgi:hypothetical protein